MVSPSRLPADLARVSVDAATSVIQDANDKAVRPDLVFFHEFFSTWLRLDPKILTSLFATLEFLSKGTWILKDLFGKFYWSFSKFLTASISVPSSDNLNYDIINWIGQNVLERRIPRVLAAKTEKPKNDTYTYDEETEDGDERRQQIKYLPTFETVWFVHDRNIFIVHRVFRSDVLSKVAHDFADAPTGDEPLVIMVVGRSVAPIKRFLTTCRDSAARDRQHFLTIHVSGRYYWQNAIKRPMRPLETVHFDEATKADLVADIEMYLDPSTRHFYTARGIPYRRGYLLHGPPGTGKTSLCLALSTHFRLDLYLLQVPGVGDDDDLARMFKQLPAQCIVLLEDIDAVGMQRRSAIDEMEEEEKRLKDVKTNGEEKETEEADEAEDEEEEKPSNTSNVTLSGLLNVIDGVTSQEGRIVIMTSNFAARLDKALTRPGRIDRQVYLGNISPGSAKLMFIRMFAPDSDSLPLSPILEQRKLEKLALEFSTCIPEDTFTPAELQGFLITHRHSAIEAIKETRGWVEEQQRKRSEDKERAKRLSAWKAKKREAAKQVDEEENIEHEKKADEEKNAEGSMTTESQEKVNAGNTGLKLEIESDQPEKSSGRLVFAGGAVKGADLAEEGVRTDFETENTVKVATVEEATIEKKLPILVEEEKEKRPDAGSSSNSTAEPGETDDQSNSESSDTNAPVTPNKLSTSSSNSSWTWIGGWKKNDSAETS